MQIMHNQRFINISFNKGTRTKDYFQIKLIQIKCKLDLAFNNVKPKDWYFVLDYVRFRTELGCVRLTNQKKIGWMDQRHHSWYLATLLVKVRVD